jgi:hypothetical protein
MRRRKDSLQINLIGAVRAKNDFRYKHKVI